MNGWKGTDGLKASIPRVPPTVRGSSRPLRCLDGGNKPLPARLLHASLEPLSAAPDMLDRDDCVPSGQYLPHAFSVQAHHT